MGHARAVSAKWHEAREDHDAANSSVSMGSSMAQQAKKLVGEINCAGDNARTAAVVKEEASTPYRVANTKRRTARQQQYGSDF